MIAVVMRVLSAVALSGALVAAQHDAARATLDRAERATALRPFAADVAALLADDDPRVRASALALVLRDPSQFHTVRVALERALASAPPGSDDAAFAYAAAAPWFALPIDEGLAMLASGDRDAAVRAGFGLRGRPDELLPHIDALVDALRGYSARPAGELLVELADLEREAVLKSLCEAASAPGSRTRIRGVLTVLERISAREPFVVRAIIRTGSRAAVDYLHALATGDPTIRDVLGEACVSGSAAAARVAIDTLTLVGESAVDQWPRVARCLESGLLFTSALSFASMAARHRDDLTPELVGMLDRLDDQELAAIAGVFPSLGPAIVASRAAGAALAARQPGRDADAARKIAEAQWVIGSHDELRVVELLAFEDVGAQVRGCELAAALRVREPRTLARLDELARTAVDPRLRATAALSRRLLDANAEIPDIELVDLVMDLEPYRVLAVVQYLRNRPPPASRLEVAGLANLLACSDQGLRSWADRTAAADLRGGRIPVDRWQPLISWHSENALRTSVVLAHPDAPRFWRGLLQHAPLTIKWQAASFLTRELDGTESTRYRMLIPTLRDLSSGIRHGFVEPLLAKLEAAPAGDVALDSDPHTSLLDRLRDSDPAVRSAACAALSLYRLPHDDDELMRLRREGSAAERRCASALLLTQVEPRRLCRSLAESPEAWVAGRGLSVLLARHPDEVQSVLAALTRPDVLAVLGADSELIGRIVALGTPAHSVLRAAWEVPELRPHVVEHLAAAGPAARPLLSCVLRALRTPQREAAGRALLAMQLARDDARYGEAREAVATVWAELDRYGRRELLAAVGAFGEDVAFARDGIRDLLQRGTVGRTHRQGSALEPALQGWLDLALRDADAETQGVALIALASAAEWDRARATSVATLWQNAADSPALRAVVRRWASEVRGEDARRMAIAVLESIGAGRPLPASVDALVALESAVREVLPEVLPRLRPPDPRVRPAPRGTRGPPRDPDVTPSLPASLAMHLPTLFLDCVDPATAGAIGLASADTEFLLDAASLLPPSSETVARLSGMLERADAPEATRIARALIAQGEIARDVLGAHLSDASRTAAAVGDAVRVAGAAAEFLLPVLEPDASTRPQSLARALDLAAGMGHAGLRFVARHEAPDDERQRLVEAARSPDAETCIVALRLLAQRDPAVAEQAARSALGHPESEVRTWASLMLFSGAARAVEPEVLLAMLWADEQLIRRRGLEALIAVPEWTEPVAIVTTELLADPDPRVRAAAVAAFETNPGEARRSRVALREALASETEESIKTSLRALVGDH